jgi:hypothetical protein
MFSPRIGLIFALASGTAAAQSPIAVGGLIAKPGEMKSGSVVIGTPAMTKGEPVGMIGASSP